LRRSAKNFALQRGGFPLGYGAPRSIGGVRPKTPLAAHGGAVSGVKNKGSRQSERSTTNA
jgi:hypothetical protein